jgi:hypothetical protein
VRYITHEFAHAETLDRAQRWLIQAGFDPNRIEVHHQGIPRIAVAVEPAAESSSASFVVGWRPVDSDNEVTQASTDVELQKEYRERFPD